MTSEEIEASQSGDDAGMGGPGAPTPLTALEVTNSSPQSFRTFF